MREIVANLAEAGSTQAKIANRYWLALAVFSVLFILSFGTTSVAKLPFGIGQVEKNNIATIGVILISVFSVAFAAAHAQVIRVTKLAHTVLKELSNQNLFGYGHGVRDIYDSLRTPSIGRVAPLVQLVGGIIFFRDLKSEHNKVRHWQSKFYLVLKIPTIVVYIGLPLITIVRLCYNLNFAARSWDLFLVYISLVFAAGAVAGLIVLLHSEFNAVKTAFNKIKKPVPTVEKT